MRRNTKKILKDNWNAFMVEGAEFIDEAIPYCPTTATELPSKIIRWSEALKAEDTDAWVCFYEPVSEYDNGSGIWSNPKGALEILKKFKGVIVPDFERRSDLPEPIRYWNIYRAHALGYWLGIQGISVINSMWVEENLWFRDFNAIDKGATYAIDTYNLDLSDKSIRCTLDFTIEQMISYLDPCNVIVYGPMLDCLKRLQRKGITLFHVDPCDGIVKEADSIPDSMECAELNYYEDFIPGKRAAGIDLETSLEDVKDIINSGDAEFVQTQKRCYCYEIGNKVQLWFARSNDRIFQIGLLPGYKGRILGYDDIWTLREEDLFKDGYGDFKFLEDDEVYESSSLGMDIGIDYETGLVSWVGIIIHAAMGDMLDQDLSDWTLTPVERSESIDRTPVDFYTEGAEWDYIMPICPTTSEIIPDKVITWTKAKSVDADPKAFVCFYQYDENFEGKIKGIWNNPEYALSVLSKFAGVITPNFSTYADFPEPIRMYNTYRMRAFGYWLTKHGIRVINNVRWSDDDSYWFSFRGIQKNSMIAIGTVGGNPIDLENRERFENGLNKLVEELSPKVILLYGGGRWPCFDKLKAKGIEVRVFDSQTNQAHKNSSKK